MQQKQIVRRLLAAWLAVLLAVSGCAKPDDTASSADKVSTPVVQPAPAVQAVPVEAPAPQPVPEKKPAAALEEKADQPAALPPAPAKATGTAATAAEAAGTEAAGALNDRADERRQEYDSTTPAKDSADTLGKTAPAKEKAERKKNEATNESAPAAPANKTAPSGDDMERMD